MANRFFNQFLFSLNKMLTFIEGNFVVGATGAVGTVKGSGIAGVTRLGVGTYEIRSEDSYPRYLGGFSFFVAGTKGASVTDGSFVIGTTYIITSLGTTLWNSYGVPAGVTPAVGLAFVATSIGGAGAGTVKAAGVSGIAAVEVVGNASLSLASNTHPYFILQCLDYTGAAADPASGSVFGFGTFVRNSSVKGKGE